jgi:hypothetical protein
MHHDFVIKKERRKTRRAADESPSFAESGGFDPRTFTRLIGDPW